jgi:hypothetical protein
MIICFPEKNWRPDEKTLINTGYYWIPRDMSEELAKRALAEGVAVLIEDDQPKKKGPAPENKVMRNAPENKAT